jgi:hypothetical protein
MSLARRHGQCISSGQTAVKAHGHTAHACTLRELILRMGYGLIEDDDLLLVLVAGNGAAASE